VGASLPGLVAGSPPGLAVASLLGLAVASLLGLAILGDACLHNNREIRGRVLQSSVQPNTTLNWTPRDKAVQSPVRSTLGYICF
jgi:hypothetical protein